MTAEVRRVLAKIIASNIHKFDTQADREETVLRFLERYGDAKTVEDIPYFNHLYSKQK